MSRQRFAKMEIPTRGRGKRDRREEGRERERERERNFRQSVESSSAADFLRAVLVDEFVTLRDLPLAAPGRYVADDIEIRSSLEGPSPFAITWSKTRSLVETSKAERRRKGERRAGITNEVSPRSPPPLSLPARWRHGTLQFAHSYTSSFRSRSCLYRSHFVRPCRPLSLATVAPLSLDRGGGEESLHAHTSVHVYIYI